MEAEEAIQIIDKAKELMCVPHAVVTSYNSFATDAADEQVKYGDPAACKFCMSGIIQHAAAVIQDVQTHDSVIDWEDEARIVLGPQVTDDEVESLTSNPAIGIFSDIWNRHVDHSEEEDREAVRMDMLKSLDEMRSRWTVEADASL